MSRSRSMVRPSPKTLHSTLIVAVTVVLAPYVGAAPQDDEIQWAERAIKVDRYLSSLDSELFSGVVMLAANDEIVLSKGYGIAIDSEGVRFEADTIFSVDSIGKQFTAAAVLRLEDQGKLSTDDTLDRFFDDLPDDKRAIKVIHLLTHASGLVTGNSIRFADFRKQAVIQSVFSAPLNFTPGAAFEYCNMGYVVLAAIIEEVSGESYEEFMRTELFEPAGMHSTGLRLPRPGASVVAHRYDSTGLGTSLLDQAWPDWNVIGAGNVLSSGPDLLRWHQALSGDVILSTKARAKLYRPGDNEYGYACGWVVRTVDAGRLAYHNGASGRGSATQFSRYLDANVVLILHCNRDGEMLLFDGPEVLDNVLTLMWEPDAAPPAELRSP